MRAHSSVLFAACAVCCLFAATTPVPAALMQTPVASASAHEPQPVLVQGPFRVYSAFWPNLHHVLYAAAWARRSASPATRSMAGKLPDELSGDLSTAERTAWDDAVAFYDRELASKDLLFDDEMQRIARFLISVDESVAGANLPHEALAAGHRQVLEAAAPVYRKYWWPDHDRANRAWMADIMPRVQTLTPEVPQRLARLYGTPWFTDPVRVDVVRVANRQGAYTSTHPTHVTVSSSDPNDAGWSGAEILFHESSHALVGPVVQAFDAESRAQQKKTRDLWHVALFYLTGEVVRQTLADRGITYEPYIYRTGLFDRAWPDFKAPIENGWAQYVHGSLSRDEAIKRTVEALK